MKYPIQFVPQGVIPRDPNLTFRMQRAAPPAEPVPEAPAPAPCVPATLLLLANFDGVGNLSSYVADSGQSFVLIYATFGSLADYVLDGDGALLSVDALVVDGLPAADVAPTTSAYKFEVLAIINDVADWSLQLNTVDASNDFFGAEFYIEGNAGPAYTANVLVYDDTFSPLYSNLGFPVDLPPVGRPVLIGIEVTTAGTFFLINDVVVASTTFKPDVIPTRCAANMRTAGSGITETLKFYGVA